MTSSRRKTSTTTSPSGRRWRAAAEHRRDRTAGEGLHGDRLVHSFEALAARNQYDVILTSTDYQTATMTNCVRRMLERKVDGVAIMTSEMDRGLLKDFARRGVPLVFMDVGRVGPRMSHVLIDYANGIRQAVDHVAGLGHRRVAFITGPLDLHSARTRRQAFLDGMRAHGSPPDPRLVREGTHTAEGGRDATSALLKLAKRPTAVVCSNDWTAIGALHAIDEAGLRVPEDISIVGFDDIPLASYTKPPLTSVRMSAGDVGSTAFDALVRLIDGERLEGDVYQVPTQLVVRQSTARPRR